MILISKLIRFRLYTYGQGRNRWALRWTNGTTFSTIFTDIPTPCSKMPEHQYGKLSSGQVLSLLMHVHDSLICNSTMLGRRICHALVCQSLRGSLLSFPSCCFGHIRRSFAKSPELLLFLLVPGQFSQWCCTTPKIALRPRPDGCPELPVNVLLQDLPTSGQVCLSLGCVFYAVQ